MLKIDGLRGRSRHNSWVRQRQALAALISCKVAVYSFAWRECSSSIGSIYAAVRCGREVNDRQFLALLFRVSASRPEGRMVPVLINPIKEPGTRNQWYRGTRACTRACALQKRGWVPTVGRASALRSMTSNFIDNKFNMPGSGFDSPQPPLTCALRTAAF